MKYRYKTIGTCSQQIDFELDDDNVIHNVQFYGGCNGNLQGISRLIDGQTAESVVGKLAGIQCGMKPTSCPDQLATALRKVLEKRNQQV